MELNSNVKLQNLSLQEAMTLVVNTIEGIDISGSPKELYEPIDYILKLGGKRLRPVLVCLACDLFGGDVANSLHAAKGIEVFHNFSLVHDDIMDNASLRRGQATVHEKWNQNIAILAGDTMLVKAYDFVLQGEYSSLKFILQTFNKAAIEVCEGQQLDMNFETSSGVTVEEYINMIRLKTSVLLGAALKIGALIGGADEQNAQKIYDFGVSMGIGFQLMDDYLDAFGDPKKFGKKVGGDILCNKKTFLFIESLKRDATGELEEWLLVDDVEAKGKVEAVKNIYIATGVDQLCLDKMNWYYNQALLKLDEIEVEDAKKQTLRDFSNYIRNRVL